MPGKFCPALVDEQAVLKKRFGFDAVFGDIASDDLNGSLFQFYLPITVAFTQDDQRIIWRIEIVKVKCCDFTGPGAGVLKQVKNGVVTKAEWELYNDPSKDPV